MAKSSTATATPPAKSAKGVKSGAANPVAIRPLHDKILVRRDEAQDRTESGIFLPERAKDTPKTGVVVAVGTGSLNTETGELIPLTVKNGDRVIFSSYAGTEVKLGIGASEQDYLVMSEDEVLAIID